MFDERMVETPDQFKPGRPANHYLHFGAGHHACFGRYISMVQIPQILKPLLAQDGLKLAGAPELAGAMKVFPDKVTVAVGG
jgi:cytochrome P450